MLLADPTVLRDLIAQYEDLHLLYARTGDDQVRRRMDDVTYTLCVTTGTRDIAAALTAARDRLSSTRSPVV